jgi:hypothetical protein
LSKQEQTNYGNAIHTGGGCNYAELHRPVHYGDGALLHLWVHHQLEYAVGAAPAVSI